MLRYNVMSTCIPRHFVCIALYWRCSIQLNIKAAVNWPYYSLGRV